jgi:hypothetical protein
MTSLDQIKNKKYLRFLKESFDPTISTPIFNGIYKTLLLECIKAGAFLEAQYLCSCFKGHNYRDLGDLLYINNSAYLMILNAQYLDAELLIREEIPLILQRNQMEDDYRLFVNLSWALILQGKYKSARIYGQQALPYMTDEKEKHWVYFILSLCDLLAGSEDLAKPFEHIKKLEELWGFNHQKIYVSLKTYYIVNQFI